MTRQVSREVDRCLGWHDIGPGRYFPRSRENGTSGSDYVLALARDQESLYNTTIFRAEGREDFLNAWERA